MKKSIIFSILIATFLFGCKTQQKSTAYSYDDVYSTRADHPKTAPKPNLRNEDLTGSQTLATTDSSTTLKATSAASTADYSSNSYATRMKRFNDKNPGLNYNSDYYTTNTDSTATGSGDSSPDVNVYFGNSWGSPFYGSSFSFGMGYGWGNYYGFGYPYSFYDPFYWGYPYYYSPYYYSYWDYPYYGGYGYGNHHHYWDWNSGGHRDRYYGQRRTLSPTDGGKNVRTTTDNNLNRGQVSNTRAVTSDQNRSGRTNPGYVAPDKQRYTYTRSVRAGNTKAVRPNPNARTTSDRTNVQRQAPAPRYSRPGTQQQATRTNAQTYSSPAYRQPKSSQEYISPRTQQGRPTGVSDNSNRSGNSNQGSTGRRYVSPSNNGNNGRIYSTPSGGNRGYSAPSRSYSTPSRSSGAGYSSPSRSSGSGSSSPSRSGGNSGGGNSGGGGGGGRHR